MARKILLADDSVTAQNMGRKILADAGYDVLTVNNGSAALKKIAEFKPDLVILDVYMPGYSGLEVCQRLKDAQETANLPVMLSVGKLEPFKPEEAKRVRADGFIIKPFEASELLTALSKLEDKIVPREAAKSGRQARGAAEDAIPEKPSGKEETGWRKRIGFPSKKKTDDAVGEDGNDPAIYNAMNKDLRTTVERKPAEKPHQPEAETTVNLGALAPEGCPQDVTPEEIAALAAAAAQVKSTLAEAKTSEVASEKSVVEKHPAPSAEAPTATFAESKSEESPAAKTDEAVGVSDPSHADVAAAIEHLDPNPELAPHADSAAGPEPMTMAAAGSESQTTTRWAAVAVALAPEEAGISLEQEMQSFLAASAQPAVGSDEPVQAQSESSTVPAVTPVAVTEALSEAFTASTPELAPIEAAAPAIDEAPQPELPQAEAAPEAVEPSPAIEAVAAEHVEPVSEPAPEVAEAEVPAPQAWQEPVQSESVVEAPQAHAEIQPQEEKHEEEISVAAASVEAVEASAEISEAVASTAVAEVSADQSVAEAISEPAAVSEQGEVDHKESEIAATTAAAWASWRRIRETGDSKPSAAQTDEFPRDEAAMAVAAGAEKAPEEATDEPNAAAIASIVESVLAEMRPKIFEEVSRKLAKKK